MEKIAGDSLIDAFRKAPIPYDEVIDIGARVATALCSLHRQDVIHLDIKPSNIMFRPPSIDHAAGSGARGDAVFVDFGLSRHLKLPDLLAEEFRLPMGTAPYIAPEQVLKLREEPRSDIFSLGVLLYALATGHRPFGKPRQSFRGLVRRLHEAPTPPRLLRKDMPRYLQEIILRCLEVRPERRYPTADQLAFDLRHPEQVVLSERADRAKTSRLRNFLAGRLLPPSVGSTVKIDAYRHAATAPILMVAIDLSPEGVALHDVLRTTVKRLLVTSPEARMACVNVLKTAKIGLDSLVDKDGGSLHVKRLVQLKSWSQEMNLPPDRVTYHVLEAPDPPNAISNFARDNHVDHLILGARSSGGVRRYLGSVSSAVVAQAPCTVTVVRSRTDNAAPTADSGDRTVRA